MKDTKKRKAAVKAAGKLDIPEEAKKLYWLHEQYGGYTEVVRRTERSASTIGKYIRMAGMTKAHRNAVEQTIGKR